MNILALEPYYGGSHRAFLDGWSKRSCHTWTVLTLPATKWKWRMRHAAITFAAEVERRIKCGESWDMIFCSDMLNLAEFIGLVDERIRGLPSVVYFHENQLTYPVRAEHERDYHFAMTNLTTALAASAVWFNSEFHQTSFLDAMEIFLRRMPDYQPLETIEKIRDKSCAYSPGIENFPTRGGRKPGPLHILWAARWEHDKNPEDFFSALKILKQRRIKFRLGVIGQQFAETPPVFAWAKDYFAEEIARWGFQPTREEYIAALLEADVFVSTARHEFFGISVVEAIAAGAYPLLPRRLSYPEIIGDEEPASTGEFFYDSSVEELANRLIDLAERRTRDDLWGNYPQCLAKIAARFLWRNVLPHYDDALEQLMMKS